ncbi:hypothetical protein [Mycobacterium genavense]|uniref:hypothetical protein n=1 Tax=Mycobacterium genavense TaxID=36812 RepID=UPI001B7FB5CA|nr:hypothetical protein [Mycobacterium genavense]
MSTGIVPANSVKRADVDSSSAWDLFSWSRSAVIRESLRPVDASRSGSNSP